MSFLLILVAILMTGDMSEDEFSYNMEWGCQTDTECEVLGD